MKDIGTNVLAKHRKLRPAVRAALTDFVDVVAAQYRDDLLRIILFGSQARGDARADSDIDLLIVVQHDTPALREGVANWAWQVQYKHDVVITVILRSQDYLERSIAGQFPLYQNIASEGVQLWKKPSEHTRSFA